MQELRTVPDIIDALGGPTAITRALGFRYSSTASEWKRQRSIPPRHWSGLVKMASDAGVAVSAETLMAAHASNDTLPAAPPADATGAAGSSVAAPVGEREDAA